MGSSLVEERLEESQGGEIIRAGRLVEILGRSIAAEMCPLSPIRESHNVDPIRVT
jgi:hypothetical protein